MFFLRTLATVSLVLLTSTTWADTLTTGQVVQDLTYFRDAWGAKERSYTPVARSQMEAFIEQHIRTAHPMSKAELALIFSEAAAMSGNNHTLADIYMAPELFHALPISFWWFPDGAVVTRADPAFHHLLGARIISVGDVPIEQAATKVERFIPGTATHKRYIAPLLLTRIEVLSAAHLASGGKAKFEFRLASNKIRREELGISPTNDPAAQSPAWRASMVPGKGPNPWPHVLDAIKELPLYLQKPDEMSGTTLRGGAVLYVRSTSLSPYTDNPLAVQEKAYKMMDDVAKSGHIPSAVIVDLRYNEGGNFLNVTNLATELVRMTEPAGRIYVITGRATNSAAIVFAALLKGGAPSRTHIVGEEISDHEWFWSEGGTLTAPASGLPLRYTDGYHDWANGCSDLSRCYWPASYHSVKAGSLKPDVPISVSFKDYALGLDPILDWILSDIEKNQLRH